MSEIIFYVAEASILLAVFYALYTFIFSRETFFQLNRMILLAIPLLSLGIPLIHPSFLGSSTLAIDQRVNGISDLSRYYYDAMASWEYEVGAKAVAARTIPSITWMQLSGSAIILVYAAGVLVCLSRTVWSIRWVVRALTDHPCIDQAGVNVVKLSQPTVPFSFMNYVFVHAPLAETKEFSQILAHERVHIEEKHTVDLLYSQLAAAVFWFHPIIWQLLKSLKTIHEYIADRKIIESGYSVAEYQTLLLRQLISNNSCELVHNFNLSFIKKRITMMTNKRSGSAGRTRVILGIAAMILFSVIIMQCNSKIEDEVVNLSDNTNNGFSGVNVPVVPASDYKFEADLSKALVFKISGNELYINGRKTDVSGISSILGDEHGRHTPIVMMVDKDQRMGFVREVQFALRVADRRKLLYIGQTSSGERVELMLILPPDPNSSYLQADINKVPQENLLKIDLGGDEGPANQKRVYDFVTSFLANGRAERAVVSARIDNDKTYERYLSNYFFIKEGYIQLYEERSQKMFGKKFYKTTKEEYRQVRENVPMNISIAED